MKYVHGATYEWNVIPKECFLLFLQANAAHLCGMLQLPKPIDKTNTLLYSQSSAEVICKLSPRSRIGQAKELYFQTITMTITPHIFNKKLSSVVMG